MAGADGAVHVLEGIHFYMWYAGKKEDSEHQPKDRESLEVLLDSVDVMMQLLYGYAREHVDSRVPPFSYTPIRMTLREYIDMGARHERLTPIIEKCLEFDLFDF